MNIGNFFNDIFARQGATSQQQNTDGPKSAGMSGNVNNPQANQGKFEEVKSKQGGVGGAVAGQFGAAGKWFQNIGGFGANLGYGWQADKQEKQEKNYTTCLTYSKTFQGKNYIMTGATGGIGSKVAKKLLKAGARVVMFVQDASKLEAALNLRNKPHFKQGRNFFPINLNLREPYQIEKKFRQAMALIGGHLDGLILCHGYIKNESIMETNMLEWDLMMNLNVRPHFQLMSIAVPFLKITKGSITVLSSTAGEVPQPGSTIYSTSMAMLNMLIKTSALETAFHGIRVNGVAAGVTATTARTKKDSLNFNDYQNKTFMQEASQDVPLQGQINLPSDVARSILWLASEDASFVTGEILTVDGGQSLTTNTYSDYLKELEAQNKEGGIASSIFGSQR